MARLTSKSRNALSSSVFALPGRRYPIEDANHARNALARVSQHGSPAEKATVRAKVHEKFPAIGGHAMRKSYSMGTDQVRLGDEEVRGAGMRGRNEEAPKGAGRKLGPHEFGKGAQSSSGGAKASMMGAGQHTTEAPPKHMSKGGMMGAGECMTGSGLESAMHAHADKVHPVSRR